MKPRATGERGADEGRKVPPFGRRSHEVTHAQARRMRRLWLRRYGRAKDRLVPVVYGRVIFDRILRQKGCVGVRFYPGLDDDRKVTLLFVGVDNQGNDILEGRIGDSPWRCPPYCSLPNGVLQF